MPTLPPLADDNASAPAAAALLMLKHKLGHVPNMYRTFAHAPSVLDSAVAMSAAIRKGWDAKLRELAYLKVVQLTKCHVWRYYHEALGRRAGLTEPQISELARFEESNAYSEVEKDVLRFVDQWTGPGIVAQEVLDRLMAVLTPAELVLLAATAAQANFTSRFNNVFGVELP